MECLIPDSPQSSPLNQRSTLSCSVGGLPPMERAGGRAGQLWTTALGQGLLGRSVLSGFWPCVGVCWVASGSLALILTHTHRGCIHGCQHTPPPHTHTHTHTQTPCQCRKPASGRWQTLITPSRQNCKDLPRGLRGVIYSFLSSLA